MATAPAARFAAILHPDTLELGLSDYRRVVSERIAFDDPCIVLDLPHVAGVIYDFAAYRVGLPQADHGAIAQQVVDAAGGPALVRIRVLSVMIAKGRGVPFVAPPRDTTKPIPESAHSKIMQTSFAMFSVIA